MSIAPELGPIDGNTCECVRAYVNAESAWKFCPLKIILIRTYICAMPTYFCSSLSVSLQTRLPIRPLRLDYQAEFQIETPCRSRSSSNGAGEAVQSMEYFASGVRKGHGCVCEGERQPSHGYGQRGWSGGDYEGGEDLVRSGRAGAGQWGKANDEHQSSSECKRRCGLSNPPRRAFVDLARPARNSRTFHDRFRRRRLFPPRGTPRSISIKRYLPKSRISMGFSARVRKILMPILPARTTISRSPKFPNWVSSPQRPLTAVERLSLSPNLTKSSPMKHTPLPSPSRRPPRRPSPRNPPLCSPRTSTLARCPAACSTTVLEPSLTATRRKAKRRPFRRISSDNSYFGICTLALKLLSGILSPRR